MDPSVCSFFQVVTKKLIQSTTWYTFAPHASKRKIALFTHVATPEPETVINPSHTLANIKLGSSSAC